MATLPEGAISEEAVLEALEGLELKGDERRSEYGLVMAIVDAIDDSADAEAVYDILVGLIRAGKVDPDAYLSGGRHAPMPLAG